VEGIGTGRVPPHTQHFPPDEARAIREEDARALVRRLAKEEGIPGRHIERPEYRRGHRHRA
jgi:cysteine synthase